MSGYEAPKGALPTLATMLFVAGLALSILLDGPWIGITLMVAGVLLSISLLFVQWRSRQRQGG